MDGVMREETQGIQLAPWMHLVTTGNSLCLDQLLPASGHVYVARLNGQDMADEMSTFEHFYSSLKFPEYFGWNWDAFYDCLRDLQWLSAEYHILIIESADSALRQDSTARTEFFRSLWRAGKRWSYTKRPEGVTLNRFSVVLSCDRDPASNLARDIKQFKNQ
ncbi:barstar family protein [Streptomyces sp. NPDC052196]|uniref:barstar family protein n=1 Tax=Streptomyces sp. NPDC052196 TaxID=3156691 RepID=UPI00343E99DD